MLLQINKLDTFIQCRLVVCGVLEVIHTEFTSWSMLLQISRNRSTDQCKWVKTSSMLKAFLLQPQICKGWFVDA